MQKVEGHAGDSLVGRHGLFHLAGLLGVVETKVVGAAQHYHRPCNQTQTMVSDTDPETTDNTGSDIDLETTQRPWAVTWTLKPHTDYEQ